jgi:hypothetical protein
MTFKIGDKVKCIKEFKPFLTLNSIYEVKKFNKDQYDPVQVLDDNKNLVWFFANRFELFDHDIHISEHNPFNYKLCNHDWFDYLGLNERFTFCKRCDKRKV